MNTGFEEVNYLIFCLFPLVGGAVLLILVEAIASKLRGE